MSDNTKNPNPRNLGDYEEGLDDDFDVPTYRRIADDGPAADVAPTGNAVPASKADIADGPAPESDAATEIIELDGTGAGHGYGFYSEDPALRLKVATAVADFFAANLK